MKKAFIILTFLANITSTFAGTFTIEETGLANWSMKTKDSKGTISLLLHAQHANNVNLTSEEALTVSKNLYSAGLGKTLTDAVQFQVSDERSKEQVAELVKNKLLLRLKNMNVQVKNYQLKFENMGCKYKKKEFICSSMYNTFVTIDFN